MPQEFTPLPPPDRSCSNCQQSRLDTQEYIRRLEAVVAEQRVDLDRLRQMHGTTVEIKV